MGTAQTFPILNLFIRQELWHAVTDGEATPSQRHPHLQLTSWIETTTTSQSFNEAITSN
jgi:hypothetical protein